MIKPIFVVKCPCDISVLQYKEIAEQIKGIVKEDYYAIVLKTNNKEFDFEMFVTSDFEKIKFDELRKKLEDIVDAK